ncbi:hypothetical protein [Paenibacillus sp. Marseille-Q4541]|uniref:hypothetical protein n=1 Tax=Paenibacillus sp. Marseille-Q4541 TaxID=2831522 RepID=UPI001BADB95D|nr:hypothetical protein [Paenibacillus sp. Marseille-Q4541]
MIYTQSFVTGITLIEIQTDTYLGYIYQVITAGVFILLGYLLSRKNIGFTFIPFDQTFKFKLSKLNSLVLFLAVICVGVAGSILSIHSMIIGLTLVLVLFTSIFALAIKSEVNGGLDR